MMKAVTLWGPWAAAVAHLGKPVENRNWIPTFGQLQIGESLAIHAGIRWDAEDEDWIRRVIGKTIEPEMRVRGAVVCVVQYGGHVVPYRPGETTLNLWNDSLWFSGQYGWVFKAAFALPEPIPCRGQQRIWTLPPAVEAAVRVQLKGTEHE